MSIEEFWNQAFLAALIRLPAEEARKEAELATQLCIEFWQSNRLNWAPLSIPRWQEQNIASVPKSYSTKATAEALAASAPS